MCSALNAGGERNRGPTGYTQKKRVPNGTLFFHLTDLELFKEFAGRAGDVNSAWGSTLAILYALNDTCGFGAFGAIRALVSIHDLLTVAGLGNLRHDDLFSLIRMFRLARWDA